MGPLKVHNRERKVLQPSGEVILSDLCKHFARLCIRKRKERPVLVACVVLCWVAIERLKKSMLVKETNDIRHSDSMMMDCISAFCTTAHTPLDEAILWFNTIHNTLNFNNQMLYNSLVISYNWIFEKFCTFGNQRICSLELLNTTLASSYEHISSLSKKAMHLLIIHIPQSFHAKLVLFLRVHKS